MSRVSVLMLREWYRFKHGAWRDIINYSLLWPCSAGIGFAYLAPIGLFGSAGPEKAAELFFGSFLIQAAVVCFMQTLAVMRERFSPAMLDYHISVTSFSAVFCARFLFSIACSFCLLFFYIPVVKLLLGAKLATPHMSWGSYYLMLFCAVFCIVSYMYFWAGFIRSMRVLGSIWKRGTEPLLYLGGLWAPAYAILKVFPNWSPYLWLNPFLYASEGFRHAALGSEQFTSVATCSLVLLSAGCVLSIAAYCMLRRRIVVI